MKKYLYLLTALTVLAVETKAQCTSISQPTFQVATITSSMPTLATQGFCSEQTTISIANPNTNPSPGGTLLFGFIAPNQSTTVLGSAQSTIAYSAGIWTVIVNSVNNACTVTQTIQVSPNSILAPNVSIVSNTVNNMCAGYALTASGAISYTWSTGQTGTIAAVTPTSLTTYSVIGMGSNGCANATSISLNALSPVYPTLTVISTPTVVYSGQTVTLIVSGADSIYHWYSPAAITGNTVSFTSANSFSYSAIGVNINGCNGSAQGTINVFSSPEVCQVTTDSTSNYNYNIIYWDNLQYTRADSFFVYRYDLSANNYLKLGAVSHTIGQFTDTLRYIGSSFGTNGDPNYGSYKYKIAYKDTDGYVSSLSPYHLTEFLQNQFNGNFNVSAYNIENGQTNPVTGYALMRDNSGSGNFAQIATIPTGATSAFDPQYSNFPNANYRVDVLGFVCAGAGNKTSSAKNIAHSNLSNRVATGIKEQHAQANKFSVFPNPVSNVLMVQGNNIDYIVVDALGKEILRGNGTEINVSQFENGVYFIKSGNYTIKFVKY